MPRDVEFDHRVEELDNGEIIEIVKHRRIFSDQEAYDYFANLRVEEENIKVQIQHAKDTVEVAGKRLKKVNIEVEKWKPIADKALERLKLNEVKEEEKNG